MGSGRPGDLYVADTHTVIERVTPGGVVSVFASMGLSSPAGLAFDASGNLYVANFASNTVDRSTPDGVPEPASAMLLVVGLIGLVACRGSFPG